MPAETDREAAAMRLALAVKNGAKVKVKSKAVKQIAESMTADKIKEFTHT